MNSLELKCLGLINVRKLCLFFLCLVFILMAVCSGSILCDIVPSHKSETDFYQPISHSTSRHVLYSPCWQMDRLSQANHWLVCININIINLLNQSRKSCRHLFAENSLSKIHSEKLVEKQLLEKSAAKNSSQAHKIKSAKFGDKFVIVLYYQQKYCTRNVENKN